MRSLFPGMDPFIEAAGLWEDFHSKLIMDIERSLSESLPERYVVRANERRYLELVYPGDGVEQRQYQPDVAVLAGRATTEGGVGVADQQIVATADEETGDVVMRGLIELERRETFLEILELAPQRRLITCIEVLSPANKRRGSPGWILHERKRQAFLAGHANLVEIDLLRRGSRMPMEGAWPDSPYCFITVRKEDAPQCIVRPATFREPLPLLVVPLDPPDADAQLEIQAMVADIYARSRYHQDIDYHKPLVPALSEADAVWLEGRFRENG